MQLSRYRPSSWRRPKEIRGGRGEAKGMFVQRTNPVTGKAELAVCESDEHEGANDHEAPQPLAEGSCHLEMLNDTARNEAYWEAIVRECTGLDEPVKGVDIGTGTGLLAFLLAKNLPEGSTVSAYECYPPLASLAKSLADQASRPVTVKAHRSEDGEGEAADLFVAEIFDSELIGEGCIPAFRDAMRRHARTPFKGSIIPSRARIMCQIVGGPEVEEMAFSDEIIGESEGIRDSRLSAKTLRPAHEARAEAFSSLEIFSGPVQVAAFDFTCASDGGESLLRSEKGPVMSSDQRLRALRSGKAVALLSWWEMELDGTGRVKLAMTPEWARSHGESVYFPSHWRQVLHFLDAPVAIEAGGDARLACVHDDFEAWFTVDANGASDKQFCEARPGHDDQLASLLRGKRELRLRLSRSEHAHAIRKETKHLRSLTEGSRELLLTGVDLASERIARSAWDGHVRVVPEGQEEEQELDKSDELESHRALLGLPWHPSCTALGPVAQLSRLWGAMQELSKGVATASPREARVMGRLCSSPQLFSSRRPLGKTIGGIDLASANKLLSTADERVICCKLWISEALGWFVPLSDAFEFCRVRLTEPVHRVVASDMLIFPQSEAALAHGVQFWLELGRESESGDGFHCLYSTRSDGEPCADDQLIRVFRSSSKKGVHVRASLDPFQGALTALAWDENGARL